MTRVAFLTEASLTQNATGGSIRTRSTLARIAVHAEVTTISVVGGPGTNLYTRHRRLGDPAHLRSLLGPLPDVLHIDGLPLAHAAVGARLLGIRSVLDVCDSWLLRQKSYVKRGYVSELRGWLGSRMLMSAAGSAGTLCYISARDLAYDRARLGPSLQYLLLPNNVDESLFGIEKPPSNRTLSSAADWQYLPNADGLRWFLRRVWPQLRSTNTRLRLYGPRTPDMELPKGVEFCGFASDKQDLYRDSLLTIAPLRIGAGVKNKVVESLCAGRPVVTTPEGSAGLEEFTSGMIVAKSPSQFAIGIQRLIAEPASAIRMGECARGLIMKRGMGSESNIATVYSGI